MKLWDLAAGRQVANLTGHHDKVLSVKFTADGKTLVSGGGDKTVRLWDVASGLQVAQFDHTDAVECVALSPDGRMLAAGSLGGTVFLWEIATGAKVHLNGKMPVFDPEGKTLAVGCPDGTATLFEISTGQVVATLTGEWPSETGESFRAHASALGAVALSPDGRCLALSAERTINLGDIATRRPIACLNGHTNHIWSVAFSPDSKTLASCSQDGTVKLWNLNVLQEAVTLSGHEGQVVTVAFAPDGNLLATSGSDGKIRLWRASPFEETDRFVQDSPAAGTNVREKPYHLGDGEQKPGDKYHLQSCLESQPATLGVETSDGGLALWNLSKITAQLEEIHLGWSGEDAAKSVHHLRIARAHVLRAMR